MMVDDKLRLTWEKMEKVGEEGVQSIYPFSSFILSTHLDLNSSNLENVRFKIKDEVWWWSSFTDHIFSLLVTPQPGDSKSLSKW